MFAIVPTICSDQTNSRKNIRERKFCQVARIPSTSASSASTSARDRASTSTRDRASTSTRDRDRASASASARDSTSVRELEIIEKFFTSPSPLNAQSSKKNYHLIVVGCPNHLTCHHH